MSEYPEDIVKTARNLYMDIENMKMPRSKDFEGAKMQAFNNADKIYFIARALMAERERCAAVGYWVCAETRHVTLADKVRTAISQPSSYAFFSPDHPSEQPTENN